MNRRERRSHGHRGPLSERVTLMGSVPYGLEAGPDTAADVDRQWFQEHPGRTEYVRLPVAGEWWPAGNGLPAALPPSLVEAVLVSQAAPGDRCRRAVTVPAIALDLGLLGRAGDAGLVLEEPIGSCSVNDVDGEVAERRAQEAAEAASEDDRRWFETHLGQTVRYRPAFPDEFPPPPEGVQWEQQVEVTQLRPGVRLRNRAFAVLVDPDRADEEPA